MTEAGIRREIALVYVAVASVTLCVTYVPSPWAKELGQLVLAGTFLFGALWLARRSAGGARTFGIDLSGVLEPRRDDRGDVEPIAQTARRALFELGTEARFACLAALVVFPPFIAAYRFLHGVDQPFTLHLPNAPFDFVLGQLVIVALPEEALFRGYFQGRLQALVPGSQRVLGANVSLRALFWQAGLFALLHFLVGLQPARLAVFFPGLLFGWLRARRGGIGAAVWFHALSNVLSEILARGYF